ncbi:ribonuclease H2 catalytic subunit RNH201, partial [Ascoidea rubescens DSM 1968]
IDHSSITYHSEIPLEISNSPDPYLILGVDEAGRGPVLGPMVYGISYCKKEFSSVLSSKKYGFNDSKQLTEHKRSYLLSKICENESELFKNVGWATKTLTARDISSGMLKPINNNNGNGNSAFNLNEQAHDATINLIQEVLDKGLNIKEVYVDTVGPPASYQTKLSRRFPNVKFTVTKKADSLFPIVSCASVVAKVTRDYSLDLSRKKLEEDDDNNNNKEGIIDWGSGYPSDPRTSKWLKRSINKIFGWNQFVRFSWQTTKDCLNKNNGINVIWEDDCIKKEAYSNIS